MERRPLGDTSLEVSRLGFGCAGYWAKPIFSERAALDIVAAALDHGINFFDTGPSYADGNAERRLGKAILNSPRHDLVISTKVGTVTARRSKTIKDFSVAGVRGSVEASLKRLNLQRIPVLQLHGANPGDMTDELHTELEHLKDDGLIGHVGINSFHPRSIQIAIELPLYEIVMFDFNVLHVDRKALIERLTASGKTFVASTPLARALFSNGVFRPTSLRNIWYAMRALAANRDDLKKAQSFDFLNDLGSMSSAQAALAYVLAFEQVTSAVFSTASVQHLKDNIRALDCEFPENIFSQIEAVDTLG